MLFAGVHKYDDHHNRRSVSYMSTRALEHWPLVCHPTSACGLLLSAACSGALTYWPTTVFYPIAMYSAVYKPQGAKKHLMLLVNVVMGVVAFLASVGSIETIISKAQHFKPFHSAGSVHGH